LKREDKLISPADSQSTQPAQRQLRDLPLAEVKQRLEYSPNGLSQAEAEKRLAQYGPNEIPEKKTNPFLQFLSYFWGPIPGMIIIAAILSAVLRFGEAKVETGDKQHIFEVQVFLGGLGEGEVEVELYADGVDGGAPARQEMTRIRQLLGEVDGYVYSTAVSAARPATDYTARVIPHHPGVAVPLEATHILWQR